MVRLTGYLNLLFDEGSFPDRVDRVADAGLLGVEFYGWDRDLRAIADRVADRDLEMVYMSGGRPALCDPRQSDAAIENIEKTIEMASDIDCHNLNVKAGPIQDDLARTEMRQNVVEVLERVAPVAEAADVTLVLEPLNTRIDHPNHAVTTAAEGAEIVNAVDSPNVKLLYDCYHEQIMAGDVIRSFREHEEAIGHVHIADNPGRHEPGTGELDYANIFDAIDESDYEGFVGCEFVPTAGPEAAIEYVRSLN